jgi:type 1 glutamine amidotransferase
MLVLLAGAAAAAEPKRLLLIGQGPDGHPPATHEYMAGVRIVARLLADTPQVQATVVQADEPWTEGPDLLANADGAVIFVSQGAKWVQADPRRHEALVRLAERQGAFVGLHWGIGTRDAPEIDNFLKLVGGCHGGPDRRFGVVDARLVPADPDHPILRGVEPFDVHEELYFRLKFVPPEGSVLPLLTAEIEGHPETVSWAWQRPDGGRSFGFSGLHFHANWKHVAYRRLVAQAVLWTLGLPIPADGLAVDLADEDLELPAPP